MIPGFEPYQRVVLWGFARGLDSMRHIYRSFQQALGRAGIATLWLDDRPEYRAELGPGDLVFAVDVGSRYLGSAVPGADYVLHNIVPGDPVWDGLDEWRALRLQVYTSDAEQWGEAWGPVRRYDRAGRILFQPWGTNLPPDGFLPPVFNADARTAPFVGAVWSGGQGNAETIDQLRSVLAARGLELLYLTHVSDEENAAAVRAGRIAPAFAGAWQAEHDYLPCRVFKNVSYGALALTNVPKFRQLFDGRHVFGRTLEEVVDRTLALPEREYLELVRAQQEVVVGYTYEAALAAIGRALEEGR